MNEEQRKELETVVRSEMKQSRGRGEQQVNEIAAVLKSHIYNSVPLLLAVFDPPWNLSYEHPEEADLYSVIPGLDDVLRAMVRRLFVEEKDAEWLKREMQAKRAKKTPHQLSLFG